MQLSIDFASIPKVGYEEWGDVIRTYGWGSPKIIDPSAFAGQVRDLNVYGFQAAAIKIQCVSTSPRHAYRHNRTYEDVRLTGVDNYDALFQVAGRSTVIQNDQVVELARGDIALIDSSRPALFATNGGIQYSLVMPRQPLVAHLGLELQGALYASSGTRTARLLSQLVLDADEDGDIVSARANHHMQRAVYDLFGAVFAQPPAPMPVADKLFKRVCDVIKDGFADPDLGPSVVAAEAGISLRQLQALFTKRGTTCTHFIHSIRLDHARNILRCRALTAGREPLKEIAYVCGYRDYKYFSRVFRRRFGVYPREYI